MTDDIIHLIEHTLSVEPVECLIPTYVIVHILDVEGSELGEEDIEVLV